MPSPALPALPPRCRLPSTPHPSGPTLTTRPSLPTPLRYAPTPPPPQQSHSLRQSHVTRRQIHSRGKILSCRIALRKGVFPLNPKQCELNRLARLFSVGGYLSTIVGGAKEEFISLESYKELAV